MGYMTIKDICRQGQKYCSAPMEKDHFRNRGDHGYGWDSNKSLLTYKLIDRYFFLCPVMHFTYRGYG